MAGGGAGGTAAASMASGGSGTAPDSGGQDSGAAGGGGGTPVTDASVETTPDVTCDVDRLWTAVSDAALGVARLGYCYGSPMGTSGSVVFDESGRVIDNTGTSYHTTGSKQEWLNMLADDRWPCLSGQTIAYRCSVE